MDFRLVPETVEALLLARFTLSVRVEPWDGQVSAVQAAIRFNPEHLRVTRVELAPNSLLRTRIEATYDNIAGIVVLAAEEKSSPPSTTFVMGSVTFEVMPVNVETVVELIAQGQPKVRAIFAGQDIVGQLFNSTIRIPLIGPSP